MEQGTLQASAAAELAKLDDPREQSAIAEAVEGQGLARNEVVELVKSIKARRPSPAAKPEPVTLDVGPCTVQIKWRKKAGPNGGDQSTEEGDQGLAGTGREQAA